MTFSKATDGRQRSKIDGLARQVAGGDTSGWTQLFELTNAVLYRHAYRVLGAGAGDPQRVEDVMQEAWFKALRKLDQWDTDRPFLPWMYQVVTNTAKDARRHQSTRREDLTLDMLTFEVACTELTPDQVAERNSTLDDLLTEINKLPKRLKQVMLLHFWEGLDVGDTASAMGTSEGNVRVAKTRAMAKLKHLLAKLESPQGSAAMLVSDHHQEQGPERLPAGETHA